jgi:hypothetical protein
MFLIIIFNSIFNFASRDQNPGSTYALKCPISGFIMLLHSVAPHCLYAIWDHYICDSSFFLIPLFFIFFCFFISTYNCFYAFGKHKNVCNSLFLCHPNIPSDFELSCKQTTVDTFDQFRGNLLCACWSMELMHLYSF